MTIGSCRWSDKHLYKVVVKRLLAGHLNNIASRTRADGAMRLDRDKQRHLATTTCNDKGTAFFYFVKNPAEMSA